MHFRWWVRLKMHSGQELCATFVCQDAAVQPGAGETGLLRAGGQELAVSGGVPQGLHGD